MVIYLVGTNFKNKGAELMMHSILQETATWNPRPVVAADLLHGTTDQRAKVGIKTIPWQRVKKSYLPAIWANRLLGLFKGIARKKDMVPMGDVDVVLDGSGFRISSQFSDDLVHRRVEGLALMKKLGKKVILLPQAFGPFDSKASKEGMEEVLRTADLVFVRDRQSLAYVEALNPPAGKVHLYPDFTNLCTVALPKEYEFVRGRVLVVPNGRMLDRTSSDVADAYPDFMREVVRGLRRRGVEPLFLIHSAESDGALADAINVGLDPKVEVVKEADALKIKAIVGAAHMMVGSRFHGVVSALSQGTPALVAGWSHKYQELLADYGFEEWLMETKADPAYVDEKLAAVLDPEKYAASTVALKARSEALKEKSREMWGLSGRPLEYRKG